MTKVGKVFSLYYSTKSKRNSTDELKFDTKGIINDKYYDTNTNRSVLITSLDSYRLVKNSNIEIAYGNLGENLLVDFNPYNLPTETRLKIANVILEISQHCTLCKSLSKVDKKLPKLLKDDRGIFAKVIESGTIKEGDDIYILDLV